MKFKLGCLVVVTGLVAFCGKKAADTAAASVTSASCTRTVTAVAPATADGTTQVEYSACTNYSIDKTKVISAAALAEIKTACVKTATESAAAYATSACVVPLKDKGCSPVAAGALASAAFTSTTKAITDELIKTNVYWTPTLATVVPLAYSDTGAERTGKLVCAETTMEVAK